MNKFQLLSHIQVQLLCLKEMDEKIIHHVVEQDHTNSLAYCSIARI